MFRVQHAFLLLAIVLTGGLPHVLAADEKGGNLSVPGAAVPVTVDGKYEAPAESIGRNRMNIIQFGDKDSTNYQITAEVNLAERGSLDFLIFPEEPTNFRDAKAAKRIVISRSYHYGGAYQPVQPFDYNAETKKWDVDRANRQNFTWVPANRFTRKFVAEDGLFPQTFVGKWLELRVTVSEHYVNIWYENMIAYSYPVKDGEKGMISLSLYQGDRIRNLKVEDYELDPKYEVIDINRQAQGRDRARLSTTEHTVNGIPFETPEDHYTFIDMGRAQWEDQKRDPQNYYAVYDGGPQFVFDDRRPFLRVPKWDYKAVHLLAYCVDDEDKQPVVSVRAGSFGYSSQVDLNDFSINNVPRAAELESIPDDQKIKGPTASYAHVTIPLDKAFAQDQLRDFIEIDLTKQLEVVRHVPDPNRFNIRPVGLPSGVRIAAITLERSPLQMHVSSSETGHVFVSPQKPQMIVKLTNITKEEQPYNLSIITDYIHGGAMNTGTSGSVKPGETKEIMLDAPVKLFGYYDLAVELSGKDGEHHLTRETTMAYLPPDNRKHREDNPYGAWDWKGGHVTSSDADETGSLFYKLGFRYGLSHHSPEDRAKYKMRPGFEPRLDPELKTLEKKLEMHPDTRKTGLIFHETSISGPHVSKVPDLFHDRQPYKLNAREEERYQKMLEEALGSGKAVREKYPDLVVKFGNGPLPTKEEFYRRGFPSELFDAAGNEPGSFHRLPETQPPDYVANNASIWMDRQLLDHYGYKDKLVLQCYEVGYPNDSPGNLTSMQQADYFVRHFLHSMAWEMPFIHMGQIMDVGNSYYFSNWGASGFCRSYPRMNPKPSYTMLATLTAVMDGAKYQGSVDVGSKSVYVLHFKNQENKHIYAYWTIRGNRPITLNLPGKSTTLVDDQGNETSPKAGDSVTVTASSTVKYVVSDSAVKTGTLGDPTYPEKPGDNATVVAPLANLDNWTKLNDRSAELEAYNMMTPRRKGDFTFEPVGEFEGQSNVLSIKANKLNHGKPTMAMYERLVHKQGIELPGEPTQLGVWVNGNSGWGRLIYELEDASGQRWYSIGAAAAGENRWLLDWLPADMMSQVGEAQVNDWNTNDAYQVSRINFDGWRYVAFPLPGNFPGENHYWPANCNWRWDGDGVVKYPLKLKGITVELLEKVLYLKDYSPVKRPEIYVKDLTVE